MRIKEFDIETIENELEERLRRKIDSKTKPVGSLGRLEEIALRVGLIQQSLNPELANPIVAVFAGDHGIAGEEKVSAYPQEVTAQMVRNFLGGGAAINVFCRAHGLTPKIIDSGVAGDLSELPGLIDRKIARGTANYRSEPAMSHGQCIRAIRAGADLVEQWHESGTNIIGFGEMGIGNTSSASIITSLITGTSLENCTGRGTGLNNKGIAEKTSVLQNTLQKHAIERDPISILQTFGGFEIAMMVGGILQAAERRIIILIDGFIVTAALLLAQTLYPAVLDYTIFAHESEERGHQIQLQHLGARPLLHLEMRLGEGTGAAMAYPIVKSAVRFLNEMASFEEAGVSGEGS